jgi:DNA polymerase-3 subunit gamma/tau
LHAFSFFKRVGRRKKKRLIELIPPQFLVAKTPQKPSTPVATANIEPTPTKHQDSPQAPRSQPKIVAEPEPEKAKSKLTKKSFFSVKELYKKEENKQVTAEDLSSMPKTAFTQEQLEKVWMGYCEKMRDLGNRSFYATLSYRKPELKPNFVIEFGIDNNIQASYFTTEQGPLLDHLRQSLNNWSIQLQVDLIKADGDNHTILTDSERLNKLMEDNEDLRQFIQKLDLDWD